MKIYKQINLDIEQYIKDLEDPNFAYSDIEKSKLSVLYEEIKEGRFKSAFDFISTWSAEEMELIPSDVYVILSDCGNGFSIYKIEQHLN